VENAFLINFFLAEYFENFNEDNDDNSPEETIGLLKLAASITSSWRVRPRSVFIFKPVDAFRTGAGESSRMRGRRVG
jgi:hypothetical protein